MNKALDDLIVKHHDAKEYFEVDGNYSIVELSKKGIRAIGVAKRNCDCDSFNEHRGHNIAYARALKKLDKALDTPAKAQKGTKKARKS